MSFEDRVRFNVSLSIRRPDDFYGGDRGSRGLRAAPGNRLTGTLTWVKRLAGSEPELLDVLFEWAKRAEARMKERAEGTWHTHSGEAIAGLKVETMTTEAGGRVLATNTARETERWVLNRRDGSHYGPYAGRGKPYGIFLEVGMGGRFAVIWPTLQEMTGELNDALKAKMEWIVRTA